MAKQWTVEEVVEYERTHKPKEQVYGKYGTIAKHYLEQHQGIEMTMIGHIPDYLHGIDRQADEMYDTLYAQLSKRPEYQKTGDYIADLRKQTEMQNFIEQEILTNLVYVGEEK